VTDRLRSYRVAMHVVGNAGQHKTGRWLSHRAENSHLPFRRKVHAMGKFRSFETLQKFVSTHSSAQSSAQSSAHNQASQERQLNRREIIKKNRCAALTEWRQLAD
jgi:putative transposase